MHAIRAGKIIVVPKPAMRAGAREIFALTVSGPVVLDRPAASERVEALRDDTVVSAIIGDDAPAMRHDTIMAKNSSKADGHNITGPVIKSRIHRKTMNNYLVQVKL